MMLVCGAAIDLLSRGLPGDQPSPIWRMELPLGSERTLRRQSLERRHLKVAFVNSNVLSVSFLTCSLPHCDKGTPLRLEADFIDIQTHSIEKHESWETPYTALNGVVDSYVGALPTPNGEFLVFTGNRLIRYSSDFAQLEERKMDSTSEIRLTSSPSGSRVLLREFLGPARFKESIIRTNEIKNDLTVTSASGPDWPVGVN